MMTTARLLLPDDTRAAPASSFPDLGSDLGSPPRLPPPRRRPCRLGSSSLTRPAPPQPPPSPTSAWLLCPNLGPPPWLLRPNLAPPATLIDDIGPVATAPR